MFGGFRAELLEAVNEAVKPGKVSQVVLGVESRAYGAGKLPSELWGLPAGAWGVHPRFLLPAELNVHVLVL